MISEGVKKGEACLFCERKFVTKDGEPLSHGEIVVCKDCSLMLKKGHPAYKFSEECVSDDKGIWNLRKSEILEKMAQEADDWKMLAFIASSKREERFETFEDRWLPKFKEWLDSGIQWDPKKECYTLQMKSDEPIGIVDFYPKANKVLIRRQNKWISGGLNWLIAKLPASVEPYPSDWHNDETKQKAEGEN